MKVCKISQTQYDYRVVNWILAVHALYEFNNPLVREGKVASVSSVYTFAFKYEPCLVWQPSLAMVCRNFAVILALGKALWHLVRWFTDQHRRFSFLKIFILICLWTVMNSIPPFYRPILQMVNMHAPLPTNCLIRSSEHDRSRERRLLTVVSNG